MVQRSIIKIKIFLSLLRSAGRERIFTSQSLGEGRGAMDMSEICSGAIVMEMSGSDLWTNHASGGAGPFKLVQLCPERVVSS